MNPYPLGLILSGRRVLVVGGGQVASRRVPALLDAGADVDLVAPDITPALRALADAGRLRWTPRVAVPSDVDGAWLVHVAIDDPEAAAMISAVAAEQRVFCVRADDRTAATAWTPAVTRHGSITVAVTAGGDPHRAVAVRDAVATLLASADAASRQRAVDAETPAPGAGSGRRGTVALVGGGPGDPELITVRGRRLLLAADVVVADRLVPGLLLDELRADAELIDASKIPYGPAAAQEEINRLIVSHARSGRFVVRLKGGDPFVFGRGGEEAVACAQAGIPVLVVPGVSSSIAAPGVAGIPVTHRGVAHEFTVVSGHLAPDHPQSLVEWPALARLRGTLVILMGMRNLPAIAATLIGNGRSGDTPVAVVADGTTGEQRVVRATLATAADTVTRAGIRPPAVVVVGDVVGALDDVLAAGVWSNGHPARPKPETGRPSPAEGPTMGR
ncbi:uroporphyrinogen-III C-methyltransferase [Luedemannella helvata]|uniref:Uroporphyrinogen-III C-methyltransferase n=1 Tax=Luedemannella helvata TaxID=349315 RepID=A0ABN2L0K7_9ACTN